MKDKHIPPERCVEISKGSKETQEELDHQALCDYCLEYCLGGTKPKYDP